MGIIIQAIREYTEGLLTRGEMDQALAEEGIQGSVSGTDFTGFDYHSQAWIRIHPS